MQNPNEVHFLRIGDLASLRHCGKLVTVLGSCVSITAWHPSIKTGVMCHYLLPYKKRVKSDLTNNHFGEQALNQLTKTLKALAPLHEFEFGLFGGAEILTGARGAFGIGKQNIVVAQEWAKRHHIDFRQQRILGVASRKISLEVSTGFIVCSELNVGIQSSNHNQKASNL